MATATEFLDAFNNSFVNKDSSYLDAIMAERQTPLLFSRASKGQVSPQR